MENYIGRLLTSDEVVHHKDHNKKNNDISNPELLTVKEHHELHSREKKHKYILLKCPQCGKIFSRVTGRAHCYYGLTQYTCCSKNCSVKFGRRIRMYGLSPKIQEAIKENVIGEYYVPFGQLPLHDETYHGEY